MEDPGDAGEGGLTALTADGKRLWTVDGDAAGSPTVVDGTVYVDVGSDVRAYEPEGGDELWRVTTDGDTGSPAVADGTVYVGSFDTVLYALDAASGEEDWRFETVKWANYAPAVADGAVYLASWDTRVYGLDAGDGEKRWSVSLETPLSDPAVADGAVFVASENALVALRDE